MVLDYIAKAAGYFFGTANERILAQLWPIVHHISSLEPKVKELTDAQLRAKTDEFKKRLQAGETLDDLLPEAFAVVREASNRVPRSPNPEIPLFTMRPFDVQLLGGIVLHQGKIAEMATGEGKTLVAILPAYLNALTGRGVHIVTVNDYLAKRDRDWMGPVFEFLGMTAGAIQSHQEYKDKQQAYQCGIVYGTNSEFGFDYLRDNMRLGVEEQVQGGGLNYAIVDEVDSILIDEARTPLIISGPSEESTEKYYVADRISRRLKDKHFQIKEKEKQVHLTDEGTVEVEHQLGIGSMYTGANMDWPHYIEQSLRAHHLFKLDRDYIVKDGQVVIVDEFTGRLMEGRVWSDGLHQAVEAKERQKIKEENQTLATVTLQNYFRVYKKLAGMTGTASTEASEFDKIYGLEVVVIPPNKSLHRTNFPDKVYRTEREKWNAIEEEIAEIHKSGRPLLIGTVSIERSEMLSERLQRRGITHEVLNAKHHEREAHIVAKAGQMGHVTVSTNMAGRGTDIILGEGVAGLGGLHVVGTERHEARRIDNQLRGRSGRQGDPGSSRFYVSLEDDLMRLFASERVSSILQRLGMEEGMAIEHSMVSNAIERAQKKVEEHNFEIRKHLLEYDEVMDEQRKTIYAWRQKCLEGKDLREDVLKMIRDSVLDEVDYYMGVKEEGESWDTKSLLEWFGTKFRAEVTLDEIADKTKEEIQGLLTTRAQELYQQRVREIGEEEVLRLEQILLLEKIDAKWKDHLYAMDHLKSGIGLRGYAQIDPRVEYKREALVMFEEMMFSIRAEIIDIFFKIKIERGVPAMARSVWKAEDFVYQDPSLLLEGKRSAQPTATNAEAGERRLEPIRVSAKVGRNQPCPCGSGKKYKVCCGK
ncbi:MAG: preprotein translocase subunit SecA [Candidatus Brocadiaceae bacterium]|nr:preprotein translocase subunit SecA [Candidatus Brocadiaceae bacterium]